MATASTDASGMRKVTVRLPARDVRAINEAAVATGGNRTASLSRLLRIGAYVDAAQRSGGTVLIDDGAGTPTEVQFT